MRYDGRGARHAGMTSSNLCPGLFQKVVCSYTKSFDYSVKYCMCIVKRFDYCTTTVQGPTQCPTCHAFRIQISSFIIDVISRTVVRHPSLTKHTGD